MDILSFKQDLQNYSDSDIIKLAKMYNIQAPINDLRWLVAIRHAGNQANMILGQGYSDIPILESMDDKTLLKYCNLSKSIRKTCDPIWEKRVKDLGYDGQIAPAKDWQEIYIVLIKYKELIKNIEYAGMVSQDDGRDVYPVYRLNYINLFIEAIKLGATNIIEWLIIKAGMKDQQIYSYFRNATRYCQLDVLKLLYKYYANSEHQVTKNILRDELDYVYVKNLLCRKCKYCLDMVNILEFWYKNYEIIPKTKVADNALMAGRRDVLYYLAKIGVLPTSKSVKYAITQDKLPELQWMIDNGVECTNEIKKLLETKEYGKTVLEYIKNKK